MEWNILNDTKQLDAIDFASNSKLQVLFKHSTRCSVSSMAKKILNDELKEIDTQIIDVYYLDLIAFRDISNAISTQYTVEHQSPQILIIKNGKCIYNASHSEVSLDKALQEVGDFSL